MCDVSKSVYSGLRGATPKMYFAQKIASAEMCLFVDNKLNEFTDETKEIDGMILLWR